MKTPEEIFLKIKEEAEKLNERDRSGYYAKCMSIIFQQVSDLNIFEVVEDLKLGSLLAHAFEECKSSTQIEDNHQTTEELMSKTIALVKEKLSQHKREE